MITSLSASLCIYSPRQALIKKEHTMDSGLKYRTPYSASEKPKFTN